MYCYFWSRLNFFDGGGPEHRVTCWEPLTTACTSTPRPTSTLKRGRFAPLSFLSAINIAPHPSSPSPPSVVFTRSNDPISALHQNLSIHISQGGEFFYPHQSLASPQAFASPHSPHPHPQSHFIKGSFGGFELRSPLPVQRMHRSVSPTSHRLQSLRAADAEI
jgi:hypothetical protein